MDEKELLSALTALFNGSRQKTAPTAQYMHGPQGLFNDPSLEAPIVSAMALPITGLASVMPAMATDVTHNSFGIMTGVTATTGNEAEQACDDPPVVGKMKLCRQILPFSFYQRKTQLYDLRRLGRRQNRGEHLDFSLINNPLGNGANGAPAGTTGNVLNSDAQAAFFTLATAMVRDFAQKLYSGDPSANTDGGYAEFYGLESLVNTGYRDYETGTACAAADSTLFPFNNNNITTGGATIAAALVQAIEDIHKNLMYRASASNMPDVQWAFSMPLDLFYIICSIWPVAYDTVRAQAVVPTNAQIQLLAGDTRAMRDAMLAGRYLWVNGVQIPVLIDDAVPTTNVGAGVKQADIYLVPLTAYSGRVPLLFWQYLDYSVGQSERVQLASNDVVRTSDGGKFLWIKQPLQNACQDLILSTEVRPILRTPYLAGRVTDVRYTPTLNSVSPFPSDPYFVNGGGTSTNAPSFYSPTA